MNKAKVLKLAKGFRGRAKNCITIATRRVEKALLYRYRDRRVKRRIARSSWISSLNAATRQFGVNYGHFMWGLSMANISVNRKMLSDLAKNEPYSFKFIVEHVKQTIISKAPESKHKSNFLNTLNRFKIPPPQPWGRVGNPISAPISPEQAKIMEQLKSGEIRILDKLTPLD